MSVRNKGRPQKGLYLRGSIWWIDFTDNTGRRVRESTKTSNKTEALKALNIRKAEVAQGKFSIERVKPAPGFGKFATVYLSDYAKVNKRSWKCDEIALRKHLIPFFGNKPLDRIAEIDVQRYKRNREREILDLSRNHGKVKREVNFVTINRELAILKKVFNVAIAWGKIQSNPVTRNIKPYEEHERVRFMNDEEEVALLAACTDHFAEVVLFAIHTGLRLAEISSLTWSDIDLNGAGVTVRAGYSKNGETRRVPINSSVKWLLEKLKKSTGGQGAVFRNSTGKPYRTSGMQTSFKRAVRKSGIKDLTFHDMRHTFASRLVMSGVDLYTLQRLLGHKNQKMTLRYAHLSDGHLKKAVCLLDPQAEIEIVRHNYGTLQKEKGYAVNVTP